MLYFVMRRLLAAVPVLFLLTVIVFLLMKLVLGDPALLMLGQEADLQLAQRIRTDLGFTRPLHVQYLDWLGHVLRGDLGYSIRMPFRVTELVIFRLPVTLLLAILALGLAVLVAIPMGVIAALAHGRWLDIAISLGSVFGLSFPNFWLGILLIFFFALKLRWFPSSGYAGLAENPRAFAQFFVLPVVTLSAAYTAGLTRFVRACMLDAIGERYVLVARSKGLGEVLVVSRHALRNAVIPVFTVIALSLAGLFSGAVVTETIFRLPGLGTLLLEAILGKDVPVVQGVIIFVGVAVLVTNIIVDILYAYVDPRVHYH